MKTKHLSHAIAMILASNVVAAGSGDADIALGDIGSIWGGFQIIGENEFDVAGISVSGAGDVNGDGLADLIVGASGVDEGELSSVGAAFVVFGKRDLASIELANIGDQGFRINGIDDGDRTGRTVSGAGDVNGDGLDDLVVSAPTADPNGYANAGRVYVIFGRADSTPVDLANLGDGGFAVEGGDPGTGSTVVSSISGQVSGAGDVNGDGLADIVIGNYRDDANGDEDAGSASVVFGKADTGLVRLDDLGNQGFKMLGVTRWDNAGLAVSGAGDVNGDGLDDVIIGAPYAEEGGEDGGNRADGEIYVVFGKTDSATIDLTNLGAQGFLIQGDDRSELFGGNLSAIAGDGAGKAVGGAGDVNGDGLADVIVGSPNHTIYGRSSLHGRSYVVFGKTDTTTVDLELLDPSGFSIIGENGRGEGGLFSSGDLSGDAVAGAGD